MASNFEYQQVPESSSGVLRGQWGKSVSWAYPLLLLAITALVMMWVTAPPLLAGGELLRHKDARGNAESRLILHISDPHIDPLFNPFMSMAGKVCHSCDLSSKVHGDQAFCPSDISYSNTSDEELNRKRGYAFGRYGCNPPYLLWQSLLQYLRSFDPAPPVIVLTGDLAPHGYPQDQASIDSATTLGDMCAAKFDITKRAVRDLVQYFPNTRWAYAIGNNDHFPKDVYWQAYVTKLADMMFEEGLYTSEQHAQVVQYGSSFIDVNGVRYLCMDFTVFTIHNATTSFVLDNNEHSGNPTEQLLQFRSRVTTWINQTLSDAKLKGLSVWVVGHQPLNTKEGADEYDVNSANFAMLKELFQLYHDIIKVGLFGHINQAGLSEVLSSHYVPLFPSITAPGISPRGLNQPSFLAIKQSVKDGSVEDFEQHVFDLMNENKKAQEKNRHNYASPYLGSWRRHNGKLQSWKTMSGNKPFNAESLRMFLDRATHDQDIFFSLEGWKRAGYIGDETPEYFECKTKFDRMEEMMTCLFPEQDLACWRPDKWMQ